MENVKCNKLKSSKQKQINKVEKKEVLLMERTIRVTGKGKLAVKPDMIRLIITQTDVISTYEGAIMESTDKKSNLGAHLKRAGFEKEALKTLYFNIETEYENYQGRDKSWKQRLKGYRYTHRMKLEFPADNELLGKVLSALSCCAGHPEFSIQHTIADPEAAKNELLAKAVEDSKMKAEVLSKAAGVQLKDIVNIDYSWGEIDFVSRPVNDLMLRSCVDECIEYKGGVNLDIEADDIEVEDTVTVVWAIG